MNLKRQLLLVSLLTLVLPWAGCEFIRETESALRAGQQNMLAGAARANAISLSQYIEEFPAFDRNSLVSDQLYLHPIPTRPEIDGYFDDWSLDEAATRLFGGSDGPIKLALGANGSDAYLYVDVADRNVVYAATQSSAISGSTRHADRITLVSSNPPYLEERFVFAAEAPGRILSFRSNEHGFESEPAIDAYWQDTPTPAGYRLEARIPLALLGTHLGIVVDQTDSASSAGVRVRTFGGKAPGPSARHSETLSQLTAPLLQPDMRILVTDARGWHLAAVGQLNSQAREDGVGSVTLRRLYGWLVESGIAADFAEPDAQGRERQGYVDAALDGREMATWFRSPQSGRAIVAVAAPILNDGQVIGALIVQQGTEAILSLGNAGLARLIYVTLIATLAVAGSLLGYATWLSRRIRRLSIAAEEALESERLQAALPSALAEDEIGDLSRSFSDVLRKLDDYNTYLRSLASKLSHELRTPLAIVTSSLENLQHEPLSADAVGYTERAQEGADRLRRILSAMSEASRVDELMKNADFEHFDLHKVLLSTTTAYQDVYPSRQFKFNSNIETLPMRGAPELLIQLLDKLVDNAVGFSADNDEIHLQLVSGDEATQINVSNPGPPLPERMQAQLFDSMVSVRANNDSRHLGLGLYVAKLIADGHGGRIEANNTDDGVMFSVLLPNQDSR